MAADYVAERTENFEALKADGGQIHPGICRKDQRRAGGDLMKAARMYAQAKAGSIVYCMGITQHTVGTDNVKTLANLAMLCGNVGILRRRRQPPARPEQRPGRLRHGRPAQRLLRLPAGHRCRPTGRRWKSLGRQRPPRLGGHDHDRHAAGHLQGRHQGPVHHGRKPGPHRPGLRPRHQGHAGPGLPGGPGYLPDRNGETGRCGPAGRHLCRKGRHLLQHRAAGGPGAPGDPAGGRDNARLADHLRDFQPPGLSHELYESRRNL